MSEAEREALDLIALDKIGREVEEAAARFDAAVARLAAFMAEYNRRRRVRP